MAGMDWFRWHHGTVSDAKFQLVAKRSGASVGEVIAVWATLLEAASQAEVRGVFGNLDFEAIDCALGYEDGKAHRIYTEMESRNLVGEGRLGAWDKRQPKRERDDNSAERVKAHRASVSQSKPSNDNQNHVTPCNANNNQETPRVEKSREEKNKKDQKRSSFPDGNNPHAAPAGLNDFSRAERIAEITDDCCKAFNKLLAVPTGLLASVSITVGREKRQGQVKRCLRVVRQICSEQYGDTKIIPKFWEDYFSECARDEFKSGRQLGGKGHENWKPTFEYLTREAVVLEVFDKANSEQAA